MSDFINDFCVVNRSAADPNRLFFRSAVNAHLEADRRESAGIDCDVLPYDDWDRATMKDYQLRWKG